MAKLVGWLSRLSRRGGGTSLPGKLLLRVAPGSLRTLGRQLPRGSVVVSATNGKTTTARMIAGVLARAGIDVAHNRAGANMPGGVATALVDRTRRGRISGAEMGLFETDEAWLEPLIDDLSPHTVVLGNLSRDQLDRYGELERLADGWNQVLERSAGRATFVLNADDPLVADLGRDETGHARPRVVYFGLDDESYSLAEPEHAFDAKHCRRCGAAYDYTAVFLGHLGHYRCAACGNSRPSPSIAAERVELEGMSGSKLAVRTPSGPIELSLPLPGLYNVYNALAATACSVALGLPLSDIRAGLESFAAAFGRAEQVKVGARTLSILLIKNPAGANEVFRTLAATGTPDGDPGLDLLIALNDGIADGRDISWIWDADFEVIARHAGSVVCSGTRAAELALRLKYAGVPGDRLEVVEELSAGFERSITSNGNSTLYALPTYTALLELRELLASRGLARPYWE